MADGGRGGNNGRGESTPVPRHGREDNHPAFVLHHYPYRETSTIVEVLSRGHGRLALVARGARRPRSALRGVLLAFQPVLLSWAGKSELRTLHKAEWQGGLPALKGEALLCAFYLNELLVKLLPREMPHERLFEDYAAALHALAAGPAAGDTLETALRRFEKQLLQEIGYAVSLTHEGESGTPVEPGRHYCYFPERGLVRVPRGGGEHGNRLEFEGRTLLAIARDDYADALTQQQGKALMRMLINHRLGQQVLHTRQLVKDLRQL